MQLTPQSIWHILRLMLWHLTYEEQVVKCETVPSQFLFQMKLEKSFKLVTSKIGFLDIADRFSSIYQYLSLKSRYSLWNMLLQYWLVCLFFAAFFIICVVLCPYGIKWVLDLENQKIGRTTWRKDMGKENLRGLSNAQIVTTPAYR